MHVFPAQHPFGQLVALHTQLLPTHCWPAAQAAPVPHVHCPAAEQLLASAVGHATHAPPCVPHVAAVRALQVVPEQQPAAQLAALQTQLPLTHCWPNAQADPLPQPQVPAGAQLSVVNVGQLAQAKPGGAHAVGDSVVQLDPAQHPPGQLFSSQTHCPPLHRCPKAQVAPVAPQTQAPPAVHRSVLSRSHSKQATPAVPHETQSGVTHCPARQHPLGQLAGLHPHTPPSHCWPCAHGGAEPQRHDPPAQLSARRSHARQTPPSVPQRVRLGALHVEPVQHPEGHDSGLHPSQAPPSQRWPSGQAAHAEPLAPHETSVVPLSHASPLQQPEHDAAVQRHAFATHSLPEPQAAVQAPHWPFAQVSRFWQPPSQERVSPAVHDGPASGMPESGAPASTATQVPRTHRAPASQSGWKLHGLPPPLLLQ